MQQFHLGARTPSAGRTTRCPAHGFQVYSMLTVCYSLLFDLAIIILQVPVNSETGYFILFALHLMFSLHPVIKVDPNTSAYIKHYIYKTAAIFLTSF